MEEAERISREEHCSTKIAVISGRVPLQRRNPASHYLTPCVLGVGTRDYYRRLGYELDGPYMSKRLV